MPPKYPNSDSQNQWEKMFFETIRDSLDDDVFCLSEFVLMGHKFKKYGKPDYVIVSKRGVFVIELKGGPEPIEYVNNTFYYKYKGNQPQEGPFEQARANANALYDYFEQKNLRLPKKILFQYGVALPQMNWNIESPQWDQQQIFDSKCKDFTSYFKTLEDYWHKHLFKKKQRNFYDQMPKDIVFEIVKTLAPNFIPPKKFPLDISSSDRELMKYSNEQNAILEHALDNPRILVSGEAGTGKTLMAIKVCNTLAEEKRILLLCYNKNLVSFLKKEINEKVDIFNIHAFISNMAKLSDDKLDFYSHEYKEKARKIVLKNIEEKKFIPYDMLIIDEGQDFMDIEFYMIIEKLLKGSLSSGNWIIFYDHHYQARLFGNEEIEDVKQSLLKEGCTRYNLNKNFRNPYRLVNRINEIFKGKVEPVRKEKKENLIFVTCDETNNFKTIIEFINFCVKNGAENNQITILVGCNIKKSNFYKNSFKSNSQLVTKGDKLFYQIKSENSQNVDVEIQSVYTYKGLENYIIFFDLTDFPSLEDFYIAMTRCKTKIYVLLTKTQNIILSNIMKDIKMSNDDFYGLNIKENEINKYKDWYYKMTNIIDYE